MSWATIEAIIAKVVRVKDVALAIAVTRDRLWPAIKGVIALFTRPDEVEATTEAEVLDVLSAALVPWRAVEDAAKAEIEKARADS